MKKIHLQWTLGMALGLASCLAHAAPPSSNTASTENASRPMDPAQREAMRKQHQERMEKNLAELKTKLQLTPQQEPAWKTYTEALKPAAHNKSGTHDKESMRDQWKAQREKRQEASKNFYNALTPAQQKTFDAEREKMKAAMQKNQEQRKK